MCSHIWATPHYYELIVRNSATSWHGRLQLPSIIIGHWVFIHPVWLHSVYQARVIFRSLHPLHHHAAAVFFVSRSEPNPSFASGKKKRKQFLLQGWHSSQSRWRQETSLGSPRTWHHPVDCRNDTERLRKNHWIGSPTVMNRSYCSACLAPAEGWWQISSNKCTVRICILHCSQHGYIRWCPHCRGR